MLDTSVTPSLAYGGLKLNSMVSGQEKKLHQLYINIILLALQQK